MYKLCTIERNENPRGLLTVKYLLIILNDDAQIFHSTYISPYPRVHVCIFAIESETRVQQQRQRGEIIEFFLRNPHCVSAIIEHFVPLHQVRLDGCDNNSSAASFAAARKTSFRTSYVNRADWALLLPHLFSFAMTRSSRHERCRKLWLYEKEMSRDRE